jgi:CBS domain-containing protein
MQREMQPKRLRVRDVMSKTVVSAGENASFKDLVGLMNENRVSSLPIVDIAGRTIGVVSAGDLLLREDHLAFQRGARFFEGGEFRTERRRTAGMKAREIMSAPAITVDPEAGLTHAARTMHASRLRFLPVVDRRDDLVGIVSRVDLLAAYLNDDTDVVREAMEILVDEMLLDSNVAVGPLPWVGF